MCETEKSKQKEMVRDSIMSGSLAGFDIRSPTLLLSGPHDDPCRGDIKGWAPKLEAHIDIVQYQRVNETWHEKERREGVLMGRESDACRNRTASWRPHSNCCSTWPRIDWLQ